jgi:HAD superfamily hydrolase (TIGR01484 family)
LKKNGRRKNMIKLLATDLDGTLLSRGEDSLRPTVKEGLRALIEKGVTVAVFTGRDRNDTRKYFSDFGDKIIFACADGAYYDFVSKCGKVSLYERNIPREELLHIHTMHPDSPLILKGKDTCYALGNPPSHEMNSDTVILKEIRQLKESEKIFKIVKIGEPLRLPKDSSLRLHWDGGERKHYEYISRFATKGAALSDLQNRMFLSKYDTAAIGDGPNDIPLVKGAILAYAVNPKCERLQAAANKKVNSP